MIHAGKRLFITGIPTAGKSYLAKLLAEKTGGVAVILDNIREELAEDPRYKKWVNFYLDQDETSYLDSTSPGDQWKNLVAQSEALWPAFISEIEKHSSERRPVIFECVNMLPHLAKDLGFPGVVLAGSSYEEVLERNKKDPRWGKTPELQEMEARAFFEIERPLYVSEAERFGLPIFEKADDAVNYCLKILT